MLTGNVAAYYDTWRDRMLEDYQLRNARVVAALAFARSSLDGARRVLDVGCADEVMHVDLRFLAAILRGLREIIE